LVFPNFLLFFWCEVFLNIECLANLLLHRDKKSGPQLGLPIIEELWLCLQKWREEICCQPLEAFAIETNCIAQSMSCASSLDIKVKILATNGFVFYITKKKIPQNQRKEQCKKLISTQGKKRTQPSIAFRVPLTA
jgi:hypothetical protein